VSTLYFETAANRTIQIQAGPHLIIAADPLPDDLRQALETITGAT